ncbi:hypothetical protein MML48_10g00018617 [Holotrichia oblita]|uniref:Uncharacterized protein n=2 Tax=Holotrichia oblita TaxID=644536 RepID=A0ACB9SQ23_HOLOL|nr:hypothetical protein MML48_10g00018617 [Holotrichia oblita]
MTSRSCSCGCKAQAEEHKIIDCYVCKKSFLHSCVDLTSSEIRSIKNKKGMSWSCRNCNTVSNDIADLRAAVLGLQNELRALRESRSRGSDDFVFEELLEEMNERNNRKQNIIMFNVNELDSRDADSRRKYDTDVVGTILESLATGINPQQLENILPNAVSCKYTPINVVMANPGDFLLLINEIIIDERRQELRLERKHLRDTSNPFTLPNTIFRQIYRIPKHLTEELGNIIIPYMRDNIREVISIPNNLKIFIALQFFGYGSYQKITGQDYHTPMSQASVSRCLTDVITALEHLSHLISFPTTQEQCTIEKQRKGYYSLNVQIICNSKLRILAINARFPGSVHDSAIWQTSQIRATLQRMYQEGNTNSWLLGDSGYPLEPWLMTPINAPQNITEQNYNRGEWGKMPPLTFK